MAAALAEQLLALTEELCAIRPVILVVDDLQWADRASVTLWERLARSARHLPLLLVGMMRPVPQREDLLTLRHMTGLTRLRLGALTEEAVAHLVEDLARGKPGEDLRRLADGAAGNPLYLTELVDALARSASLVIADGTAELTNGRAPGSLSAAIADRLGFVPPWVREVLRAAALFGVDFAVPDLATVLHRNVADLVPALAEARAAGVLAESGSRLRVPAPADPRGAVRRDPGTGARGLAWGGGAGPRPAPGRPPTGSPGGSARPGRRLGPHR